MIRLFFLISLFFFHPCSYSQSNVKNVAISYSPAMQRLLINMLGTHLYNIYQWQIDYDSSMLLACAGEGLSHSIFVNESFDDGSPLPGKELIESENIPGASQLLNTLHGEERIKLLLQLGAYFLFKPGSDKEDMLNAHDYLTNALTLSDSLGIPQWKNGSRNMLGKYYYQAGDFSTSKTYLSETVNACIRSGDTKAIARALAERGGCELFNDTGKLTDITKSLELFRKLNDRIGQIEMLSKLAEIHFVYGLRIEAENELLEAVELEKEIGFKHIHYYYNALAFIEQARGNMNIALSYANQAISSMEEINDRVFSSLFYFRQGNVYGGLADWDRSEYWYRKSMESSGEVNTNRLWYTSFVWLSNNLTLADRYQKALDLIDSITLKFPPINPLDKMYLAMDRCLSYYGLKQWLLADKNLAAFETIADQLNTQPQMYKDVSQIYLQIAVAYASGRDMKKAKGLLQKALAIKMVSRDLPSNVNLAMIQFKIDSSEGRWLAAIQDHQRYDYFNDSGFNIRKTGQISEMNIQFGVAQKEKDLQLLQNREQLQRVELSREKLMRNIIIMASSLILLLFVFVYNRLRLKKRSNKLLQVQKKIIHQKNEVLQQTIEEKDSLLEEKEWLVREIHHRVKNNLQMVISLLNAQSEFLEHPSAVNAIRESRERMQAIAILHHKLYRTDTSTRINMQTYVNELMDNIQSSVADTERMEFHVDVAPDIELDISQSVPLGLILNEGITNSIKYAYGENEKGSIRISLRYIGDRQLQLKIADHGKGLPEGLDSEQPHSLGLQLIRLFAEQLDGDLYFVNNRGLEIKLSFRTAEYSDVFGDKEKDVAV